MFISNKSKKNNQKSVSNVEYESGSSNKLKLNNNSTSNENSLIDYTREIFENDYEKHFKKLNNVPSFPINIPVSFEFVPFFNSEIDDMNQNFNTKKPSDNFAQNSSNNNVNNNSNNSHTPQQLNQQLQLANQLQMMQYRAFLMAQQNNFLQQQLMMNNAMNPFAFNMYHQPNSFLMQQQMMANNQVNPNGLVVQQPKSELTELANIVSQVGKMMNTFQNQMVMQNNILVSQQKQVLQQQEIINKLHDKLFKGDLKQITSNTKEAEDEIEEEYLEPSETIDVLEDKFHSEDYLAKKKFLNKQTLFNEKSKLNHNVTNNLSEFSLDNANEYSSLTSEIEITDQKQIEKNKTNLEESVLANNFKKENNLEEFVQPTDNFLGFDNKELNQLLEEKKFKKLLEESKSNPSQRFWEPLVGQTKYGFYNNRVWHWLGYFDRFANWHPYKNAGEMPTLPTLHNGLINQDTKNDTLFWKRLVDNPNYGHREDGVWIWDGVFDQKLNWIPDPTADKYVLDHYAKLNKSLDSQKTEEEFFVTRKHDLREINETPHLKNDFSEHHHHHHHQHESLNENVSVNDANSFAFLPKENASKDDYQPSVEVKLVENDKITKKEKIDNVPPQKEDFVLDIPKVELEKFEPTRVNLNYDESKLDNKVLPNSTLNASELKPDSIDKNTFVNNESIVNDLSKQEVVKESKINEVVESLPADKIILNANNEHLINNEIKENISLEETISSNVSNDLVSDLNHNDVAKEEPVVEEVVEQPIQEEVVTSNEPVAEEVVEQPIEEEVSFDDVPQKEQQVESIQEEVVTSNEPVAEEVVEQPIEEEVNFDDAPQKEQQVESIQEEVVTSNEPIAEEVVEQPIEEEVSFDDAPQKEQQAESIQEEVVAEETSKDEENDEYWKQFVGDSNYGHYDPENGSWVWSGYFGDNNEWIHDPDYVKPNCDIIYADENGDIDFNKYAGNPNFGYYDEDGNWDWYAGDFDKNGNWVLLTEENQNKSNISKSDDEVADAKDDNNFDVDAWLDQFSGEDADNIFGNQDSKKD